MTDRNSQNHFLGQQQEQKRSWQKPCLIDLKTRASLSHILDEHLDYIENFSIEENNVRTLYQSLRTYMIEMLTDQTTVINNCTESREDLSQLIFSVDSITLSDFINHIYRNGSKETIIHPRAYLKKCWIDYIRSHVIHYRKDCQRDDWDFLLENCAKDEDCVVDKDCLKMDQSLYQYHCAFQG